MTDEAKEEEKEVSNEPEVQVEEAPKPKVLKGSHKKVTRMSLDEVDEALEALGGTMGTAHNSRHAQTLLAQRAALLKYGEGGGQQQKKAA